MARFGWVRGAGLVGLAALAPLMSGCGLLVGKAVSTGLSSTTDVTITPAQVALNVGQQQLFRAQASQLLGNDRSTNPAWELLGGVGYIDNNGLFLATNPGTGEVRGTVSTAAGAAHVVGKATVIVAPVAPGAPRITSFTASPASGGPATVVTFSVAAASPAGSSGIARVQVRELTLLLTADLYDDGIHGGDKQAGDGVYTGTLTIPPTAVVSPLRFGAHAEDFTSPPNSSAWSWVSFPLGNASSP